MPLLPRKIGPMTLMRKLSSDGVCERFVGILDEPAGKQVLIRKVAARILADPATRSNMMLRVRDLQSLNHPNLTTVHLHHEEGGDLYVAEDWVEAVDMREFITFVSSMRRTIPPNLFLHLAVQISSGLVALHGRPGVHSGADAILHLGLRPETVHFTRSGQVVLSGYGLLPSPTQVRNRPKGLLSRFSYMAPEQTNREQQLAPSADLFVLGAVLFELLTTKTLFLGASNLQTIALLRRSEVTPQLLEVKEILPGLDKVLFQALTHLARHRYQSAMVLREELRALQAEYSFTSIHEDAELWLEPVFQRRGADDEPSLIAHIDELAETVLPGIIDEDTGSVLGEHREAARTTTTMETVTELTPSIPLDPTMDTLPTPGLSVSPLPVPEPTANTWNDATWNDEEGLFDQEEEEDGEDAGVVWLSALLLTIVVIALLAAGTLLVLLLVT